MSPYSLSRLAGDLGVDECCRKIGQGRQSGPRLQEAIAITQITRSVGTNLTLEEIYANDFDRIR